MSRRVAMGIRRAYRDAPKSVQRQLRRAYEALSGDLRAKARAFWTWRGAKVPK